MFTTTDMHIKFAKVTVTVIKNFVTRLKLKREENLHTHAHAHTRTHHFPKTTIQLIIKYIITKLLSRGAALI